MEEKKPAVKQPAKKIEMTPEEERMWNLVKFLPVMFRRKRPVGEYVIDFYCARPATAIVIGQTKRKTWKELSRDKYLQSQGITVMRYYDEDIRNDFDTVCDDVLKHFGITRRKP